MRRYIYSIIYHGIPLALSMILMAATWNYSSWHAFLVRAMCPWQVVFEVFFIVFLIRFIRCIHAVSSASAGQDFSQSNFTIIKCGENGTGKTLTGIDYAIAMAEANDDQIRKLYKLYKANSKAVAKDEILSKDIVELEEYVQFWDAHPDCVPGLFSTVPILVDDLKVMQLKREHVLQFVRLPYGSTCLYDEAKLDFPAVGTPTAEERAEESPGADFISKVRHYGNFHFIFISQKSSELRKFIRNNVAQNEYIIKHEKILEADLLTNFIAWLEDYLFDFPLNVDFLYKGIFYLKKFINKIGFFQV